jgi:hypothetical protein
VPHWIGTLAAKRQQSGPARLDWIFLSFLTHYIELLPVFLFLVVYATPKECEDAGPFGSKFLKLDLYHHESKPTKRPVLVSPKKNPPEDRLSRMASLHLSSCSASSSETVDSPVPFFFFNFFFSLSG